MPNQSFPLGGNFFLIRYNSNKAHSFEGNGQPCNSSEKKKLVISYSLAILAESLSGDCLSRIVGLSLLSLLTGLYLLVLVGGSLFILAHFPGVTAVVQGGLKECRAIRSGLSNMQNNRLA